MSRLFSSTRARVLTAAVSSAAVALLGLGAVPSATAAPPGQISGTVTNAGGAAVKGITVTAYDADTGELGAEATTKADGTYTLKKLDAAHYTVEFRDNSDFSLYAPEFYDDQADFEDADPVAVAASQSVSGIDAVLARLGTISGTVTDEQGNPVAGAFYDILEDSPEGPPFNDIGGGQVPPSGHYSFPFVPAGTYLVYFYDQSGDHVAEYWNDQPSIFEATKVTVTAGGTTSGIDAELTLAGHLSGKVTDSEGNGIGGIEVQLGRLVDGEWQAYGEETVFFTDDDGTYRIDGLPDGTYRAAFGDPEGNYLYEQYDDKGPLDEPTAFPVTAGATTEHIDAELTDAGHIQGTVTGEAGQPLPGIWVLASHWVGDHWEGAGDTDTGEDGTYSLDGLPADDYRIEFRSQGTYVSVFYGGALNVEAATPVPVDTGETVTGIDAQLTLAAHITGTAADPAGDAYDLTGIEVWRWTGTTWEDYAREFVGDDEGPTHYDVGGLVPGTYRLEFDANDSFTTPTGGGLTTVAHEFWNDQPSLELAQDIVVPSAGQELSGYDVVLERGQYDNEVKNLTLPTITGTPKVGQTLTASSGTWNLKGTTFHYQWLAGTTPVGADAATYTPAAADVGKAVSVRVTGAVAGVGSATAQSAATSPVTALVTTPPPAIKKVLLVERPAIKGSLEIGTKARVTHGSWNPATVVLKYHWYVGSKLIKKAHGARLLLKEKWAGKRLRVKVVAKADGYLKSAIFTKRSAPITD